MVTEFTQALDELRDAFAPMGADLEFLDYQDGTARVRLVILPEACLECISPKDRLESILLAALKQHDPNVQRVELDDPRPAGQGA